MTRVRCTRRSGGGRFANSSTICFGACEREFLDALRARREELQDGYETIEAMCDLPSGYAGKLLTGWKAMGALSMWLILRTLGLNIQLIEDPATLARNRRHHQWETVTRKPKKRRWTLREIAIARRRNAPWLWNQEQAREAQRKSVEARRRNRAAQATGQLTAMPGAPADSISPVPT